MSKKLTYEFVKGQFENEGYKILSKEYKGCSQKLTYICFKGHQHSITWCDWTQGNRCPYCSGKAKKTIEFIRAEFEKESYKLLSTEYKNTTQKLDYICSNGHKHKISWASWRGGHRCPYCIGNAKLTIEFIKSEFKKEGYILLTKRYKNSNQKLEYICPNGHEHQIAWLKWQAGRRCSYCSGKIKKTIEFIRSEFKKENYKLLTTKYINSDQKLDYVCPKGHKHQITWTKWRQKQRCPFCIITSSKGEIEVRNFIKSFGINVLANDRNQIFNPNTNKGFELDIFMPALNKAIEYNGEYWHQDENKDLFKQKLCKSKIDLLTIWESEWKTQNDICKNKIKKFIFNKENV